MRVRRACGEGMHQAAAVARSACRLEAWMPIETPALRRVQAPHPCVRLTRIKPLVLGRSWRTTGTAVEAPRRAPCDARTAPRRSRCTRDAAAVARTRARHRPSGRRHVGEPDACRGQHCGASSRRSTSSGRVTGNPVTSARICRSRFPRAPPATQTISTGSFPVARIASSTSRSANALPSSNARARCARPCAADNPNHPARAEAFHSGVIAPARAGTQSTPSAPGGTSLARALRSS